MIEIPRPNNRTSLRALQAFRQERSLLAALEVFHYDLGDVFRLPLPGFNPVMVVGPEANHFVLVEERNDFRWRVEQDPITRLLRHGILVEDGDSHDALRSQIAPVLHRRVLPQYIEIMGYCTDQVLEAWQATTTPVDMLVEMRQIALLILTKTLFSEDFRLEIDRLWHAILGTLRYISPGAWVLWRDIPRPGYQAAIQQLDDYLHCIITMRRMSSPDGEDNLLSLLIAAGLSDALIRDQLLTMFIAGHDTSTALLSWALYLLSSHPHIMAQAQAEIDSVLGPAPPSMTDLGKLRYLEQVINETLRLFPPIHLGSREAKVDLIFQGYRIPAGTRVLYSIYLTHRDPKVWSESAAFIPERFASEVARPSPYSFLPFGGGPRNCIGTAFAQIEAKVVLARILQKFDLQFAGPAVRMHMGATLEPQPRVLVNVKRRC
ncbi:MAG: cytochrome P450 [Chloroflexota bacterium]